MGVFCRRDRVFNFFGPSLLEKPNYHLMIFRPGDI